MSVWIRVLFSSAAVSALGAGGGFYSPGEARGAPQTNLIKGGGFEAEPGNFPRWHGADDRFENDGCIYCGPTTDAALRGQKSCRIETTGTRGDCLRYVCTSVTPGKAYRYEFDYKIISGGITIGVEGGLPQGFRLPGPTDGWKRFAVTFIADQNQYVVTVGNFRNNARNLIYVDDVKLIELPRLPEDFTPRAFALPEVPSQPASASRHTTLLAHFDELVHVDPALLAKSVAGQTTVVSPLLRPNADYARWNPRSAGRDAPLVAGGWSGRAVALTAPRGCLLFGGEENCPTATGTVEMFLKSQGAGGIWNDDQQRWFVLLERSAVNDFVGGGGFSLQLYKDRRNQLVLRCGKGRAIEVDVSGLDPDAWHHVLFGWDLTTHRMALTVDGEGYSARMPLPLAPGEFSTLLVGNHASQNLPAGCLLDELVISDRPPTDRSADSGEPRTTPAPRPARPFRSALARNDLDLSDPEWNRLQTAERRVRIWLDWVIRAQHGGGWDTTVDSVRWPSLLCGGYDRLCHPRGLVTFGKTYNTAHTAMHLCFAYETFADPEYLNAVQRTADMYLELEVATTSDRFGPLARWPKYAYFTPPRTISGGGLDRVMIQDFYITGPILTLLYVHKLTGREDYLQAAIRGGNFLLLAQNPKGSWPHHYDWNEQAGYGTGSTTGPTGNALRYGSELNDNATTDAMRTLVALWHWTADPRYLQAVKRAADWVVEAQLDGPTFGWAAQYDQHDVPVWARAHEPPAAVWGNGALMATNALFLAHRLTGDTAYLDPIDRFLAWLDRIRTPQGWYQQYDYHTGRPIAARGGTIYFLDDPQQLKRYQAAGGGSAGYWQPGAMRPEEYERIERTLQAARRGEFLPTISASPDRDYLTATLRRELANTDFQRDVDILAARYWIPEEGLWLSASNKFAAGPAFSPCQERSVRHTLRACHLARALLGAVSPEQVFPLGGDILRHRYHVLEHPGSFFDTPLRQP